MTQPPILYRAGYKYQLEENYTVHTGIIPREDVSTTFIKLTIYGVLTIIAGYAWDGPSGPTIDTKSFMRGSLVHDALYQLMRQGCLPGGNSATRQLIDMLLRTHCLEDGMMKARAWWVYKGVRAGARKSSTAQNQRQVFSAP